MDSKIHTHMHTHSVVAHCRVPHSTMEWASGETRVWAAQKVLSNDFLTKMIEHRWQWNGSFKCWIENNWQSRPLYSEKKRYPRKFKDENQATFRKTKAKRHFYQNIWYKFNKALKGILQKRNKLKPRWNGSIEIQEEKNSSNGKY